MAMELSFEEMLGLGTYPAMCHPGADCAVNAAVARKAGLSVESPSSARILEIGCGTGHHILSLACRWPEARFTGLDLSPRAIARARILAKRAKIGNVRFCEVSVLEFEPDSAYDFIIAHGFFSWVPDEVKLGLMDFISKHLAPDGIATVSFNVAAGWRERMPVVEKTRAIQSAGNTDEMTALSLLRTVTEEKSELAIIDDMLAKGAAVLAYDDFAPVMDPWSLGAFRKLASQKGLAWLGDSVSGEKGDDAKDNFSKRTFRSEILCHSDAPLSSSPPQALRSSAIPQVVPDFPKLNQWRLVCVMEGLPVPDKDLNPCQFSVPQLLVMAAMDGSRSHVNLAAYAREHAPELNFVPFLKHLAERGMFG